MDAPEYDFDVAISFAGPEREYARAIAMIAEANGLRVFFDESFEHEIWGRDLGDYLSAVYKSRSKTCLMLISKSYIERAYPQFEKRHAASRLIKGGDGYILPVLIDDSWVESIPDTTGYIDIRQKGVTGVCQLLVRKLLGEPHKFELKIPPGLSIPRVPNGLLDGKHLQSYLLEFCKGRPVSVFGFLVYDERTAEYRKLLQDQAYWEALDRASGPDFEVFALRDKEMVPAIMHQMSGALIRSMGRSEYHSVLLEQYFGEDETRLAYPSVLIFVADTKQITHCRLIPLRRGTIEEIFLRLQDLFQLIAGSISTWKADANKTVDHLWETLKDCLLEHDYTLYIQTPRDPRINESIKGLGPFL